MRAYSGLCFVFGLGSFCTYPKSIKVARVADTSSRVMASMPRVISCSMYWSVHMCRIIFHSISYGNLCAEIALHLPVPPSVCSDSSSSSMSLGFIPYFSLDSAMIFIICSSLILTGGGGSEYVYTGIPGSCPSGAFCRTKNA